MKSNASGHGFRHQAQQAGPIARPQVPLLTSAVCCRRWAESIPLLTSVECCRHWGGIGPAAYVRRMLPPLGRNRSRCLRPAYAAAVGRNRSRCLRPAYAAAVGRNQSRCLRPPNLAAVGRNQSRCLLPSLARNTARPAGQDAVRARRLRLRRRALTRMGVIVKGGTNYLRLVFLP